MKLIVFLLLSVTGANCRNIVFPDDTASTNEIKCPSSLECVPLTSCPSSTKDIASGKIKHCGFKENLPLVCCSGSTDGEASPKGSEKRGVSPPSVDFECGRLSSRSVLTNSSSFSKPTTETLIRRKRVIGGQPSPLTKLYPWLALLGHREPDRINWRCVASLINDKWLVTAAHCFEHLNFTIARFGEYDYSRTDEGAQPQDYDIVEVVLHPNVTFPHMYNDVALIRISPVVEFKTFNPVCLPWAGEKEINVVGQDLLLTGWGTTIFGGHDNTILNEVNMTVMESSFCNESYTGFDLAFPRGIDNTFLCMGHPDGGISACQGDSGGPLMYTDTEGRHTVAGVVSTGFGCGAAKYPGAHTNLALDSRLAWIKQIAFS